MLAGPREVRRLIVWGAIPAIIAVVLLVVHFVRPFGRPSNTVDKTLAALAAGDAAKLMSEERLGFKQRAEMEIKRRGEAEYNRILAIFDKEAQLGDREYRRIRRIVSQIGEKEFRRLPRDDQRTVKEYSRRQFVAEKGWAQLVEDERKQIGSQETLGDRTKLRARAIAVGLPLLSEEQRGAAEGVDLTTPESAKDKKLNKLANAAEKAGMEEIQPALQSAEAAAQIEYSRLNRRERDKVDVGSYMRWILEAGLKGADDKVKAKANLTQLIDDDAPDAWALRRSFGFKDLDPESRKTLEGRDYDKFVDGKRAFVEAAGAKLWGEKLREIFNDGCCKTATVRYLGNSGRSLRRNSLATVALEFGTPPPPKPKAKGDKTPAEEDDGIHPAKKYLGSTAMLEYRWGSWALSGFDKNGDEDAKHVSPEAMLGALASLGGSGTGFFMFLALGLVLLLAVWLKRKPAFTGAELAVAGATLGLAALQIATQGQATIDDLYFTPLYLAMPIWVGARAGSQSGFVAGFLAGVALVVASAVAGVPHWASGAGDHMLLGENLLAAVMLAGTGALAGRAKWPAELPVLLPLCWLLFFAVVDRSQLASLTCYAHLLLASGVVAIGLILDRTDAIAAVARVWRPETEI
jgi:hypothetical protein